MPLSEFTALLVLAASMSFSPGPNTTLSTALAANHGLRTAMRFVVAVPVGWCALLLLTTAGISAAVLAVLSLWPAVAQARTPVLGTLRHTGPWLVAESVTPAQPPEDELVYFV